jgi:hypothetical protein
MTTETTTRSWFAVTESSSGAPMWVGKAVDALRALDAFAEMEGFALYSDQLDPRDEQNDDGGNLVYQMPDGTVAAIFTNTSVFARPVRSNRLAEALTERWHLQLVETQWYFATKGELDLTEEPDPADIALVTAMWASARNMIDNSGAQQYDSRGDDLDTVTPVEIARRIAVALETLWYGVA